MFAFSPNSALQVSDQYLTHFCYIDRKLNNIAIFTLPFQVYFEIKYFLDRPGNTILQCFHFVKISRYICSDKNHSLLKLATQVLAKKKKMKKSQLVACFCFRLNSEWVLWNTIRPGNWIFWVTLERLFPGDAFVFIDCSTSRISMFFFK